MPSFTSSFFHPRPLEEVFNFYTQPSNLLKVSPPDLHLRLVSGPDRLFLGATFTLQGRRWGIPVRIVSEVTAYEPNVRFVDEQREGPFGRLTHTHQFEAVPGGTRFHDRIDYEPPGGLLGLVLTAASIEKDLQRGFAYRAEKLAEIFGGH